MVELLFFVLASFLAVSGCAKYDELVAANEECSVAWANIEADLERRSTLIPQLVETVKGEGKYEQGTLDKITQARASASSIKLTGDDFTDPAKMKAFEEAQAKLDKGSLSRLLVTNEAYPQLQATKAYQNLMVQLEGTENRILRARQVYNEKVGRYNTELGKIKGSVVNKATGTPFKPRVYFAASEASHAAPVVSF